MWPFLLIMTQSQFYTYLHCKPDGTPFYVGKGSGRRAHEFQRRNRHHEFIVQKYGRKNIKVFIFACESEEQAFSDEIHQISQLRKEDIKLTNVSGGGEGATGAYKTLYTHEGLSLPAPEWAEKYNIPLKKIRTRLSEGKTISEALSMGAISPKSKEATEKYITYNGVTKSVKEWATDFKMSRDTILYRIRTGKPLDKLFKRDDLRTIIYEYNDHFKSLKEWALEKGVSKGYFEGCLRRKQLTFAQAMEAIPVRTETLFYNGEKLTRREFALKSGISYDCVKKCRAKGLSSEQILEKYGKNY